ncbi:MAG: permease-like cell division protein FtsX [bacterium]
MPNFLRVFKFAFINFLRNSSVNITAISIMLLVSLSISLFSLVWINVNQAIITIEQKADVSVFLKDTASPASVAQLQKILQDNPDVRQAEYVSKEKALEIFRGRKTGIEVTAEDNPLPASFEIKAFEAVKLTTIIESIRDNQAIESNGIKFNKDAVEKILYWASVLRNLGLGMIAFLVLISFMVILSTVRLAVFTRKEEIEIMKLVGATDWFIRWPFILELSYAGVIASTISLLIFFAVIQAANAQLSIILKVPLVDLSPVMLVKFIAFQLLWGAFLGALSSYIATRAHLKV